MRVFLESNVWLAILTTDEVCRRPWRKSRRVCDFAASQDVLHEIEEKLRDKFGFSPRHACLMTFFVERQTERARAVSTINVCRDADDNRILAVAVDSGCSHLVTGDADLLVLKVVGSVSIITPREFMELVPAD